ncbi:hypothetical protein BJ138DRAFT_1018193 [Hygrophoropsis aurantiaca]|uniref:Uncharacterized protein n=1 Tax=Hygrophoropsis aurantiaca TaxID=72124 RepID=A0ACB7ZW39_9AGAM|nr:hypothetical protein BJ138DRAFT_1018193 [Hygrophoropsis aurantiaca]
MRKSKRDRKNQKLWAEGCRESILAPHIEPYGDALARGWAAERDYLGRVCNEYHALIPWRLEDDEEPDTLLPEYDPSSPPVSEGLTAEEEVEKSKRIKEKNKAIQRWLKYRVRRLNKGMKPIMDAEKNPYAGLLLKLAGWKTPPKARQGYQQYMHTSYESHIKKVAQERWDNLALADGEYPETAKQTAAFRAKIAKELYDALSKKERDGIMKQAKDARDADAAAYRKALETPPSKAPIDRQKCIDGLGGFFAPILTGVQAMTGLHFVIVGGGPVPKHNGEIGTVHINAGMNRAAVPMFWGQWKPERFNKEVIEFFREFLETCFSKSCITHFPSSDSDEVDTSARKGTGMKRKKKQGRAEMSKKRKTTDTPASPNNTTSRAIGAPVAPNPPMPAASLPSTEVIEPPHSSVPADDNHVSDNGGPMDINASLEHDNKNTDMNASLERDKENDHSDTVNLAAQYEIEKAANIARNQRLMHELNISHMSRNLGVKPPSSSQNPRKKRAKVASKSPTQSTRRSGRLKDKGEHEGGYNGDMEENEDVGDADDMDVGPLVVESADAGLSSSSIQQVAPSAWDTSDPPPPNNAWPKWLSGAYEDISRIPLGQEYTHLLSLLVELETAYHFQNKMRGIPKSGRPAQLDRWIANGRGRGNKPPLVTNATKYSQGFWDWWGGLQPSWRKQDAKFHPIQSLPYGAEWGELKCPGVNGMLSVVASIYWWGCAVLGRVEGVVDSGSREEWESAQADVTWVLEGLLIQSRKENA